MRTVLGVLAFAAVHFVASFFFTFAAGVGGGRSSPAGVLATLLSFPLSVLPGSEPVSPLVFWSLWALLSLAWGALLLWLARRLFGGSRSSV